jgi:hypothetical protein
VTRSDLIVLVPWIVVAVVVGAICARLFTARLRARRRRTPQFPRRPESTSRHRGRRLRARDQDHGAQDHGAQDEVAGPECSEATS